MDLSSRWAEPLKEAEGEVDQWMAYWCRISPACLLRVAVCAAAGAAALAGSADGNRDGLHPLGLSIDQQTHLVKICSQVDLCNFDGTHGVKFSSDDAKEVVHYQTISPKSLAKSVLEEGGWSNFMCSREDTQNNVDVAIVFIGSKLQSSDISKDKQVDPALADTLKVIIDTHLS
ncbi:hypothetical protein ZEAMMB73_Zm00001d046633 [Zea mays]|uniref:Uncharacterized protein n=1 Tax=Zea mays TaxID=4577 RepID=A0A1D6P489_MAIZE|nr:hypothetical protein ZEAMMB73_Zm00001d046633 [Zea mays]